MARTLMSVFRSFFEPRRKICATGQTRQSVACRFAPEFLFGKFAVCDVLDLENQIRAFGCRIAGGGNTPQCPDDLAGSFVYLLFAAPPRLILTTRML